MIFKLLLDYITPSLSTFSCFFLSPVFLMPYIFLLLFPSVSASPFLPLSQSLCLFSFPSLSHFLSMSTFFLLSPCLYSPSVVLSLCPSCLFSSTSFISCPILPSFALSLYFLKLFIQVQQPSRGGN